MARTRTALILAAALVVALPLAAIALTLRNGSPVDHQRAVVKDRASTTSSTDWTPVPGLASTLVCARGTVSATLTANLTGAPAQFRIHIDGGGLMAPELAHFDPTGGNRTFSATFVAKVGTFEGSDGHSFDLEWRSPSGQPVTFKRGALDLLFGVGSC
jgi:hypothetical protein